MLGWIVVVGTGSFSSCYGTFITYDAAVVWLRCNGWAPADCQVLPVRPATELAP